MNVIDRDRDKRVAWLINHAMLRAFEVPLIRSFGLEVLTSKQLPYTQDDSSSVDYSHDESLTIPREVLDRLNRHNFYEEEFPPDIVDYLNTYFGTVICACLENPVTQLISKYNGRILVRAFGRDVPRTHGEYFTDFGGGNLWDRIARIKDRFWLAPAYEGIAEIEPPPLRDRAVVLPLGLPDSILGRQDTWVGNDKRILFVCPGIGDGTGYYAQMYSNFKKHFGDLPHLIAGRQSTTVRDEAVKGWAPEEQYRKWFRDLRVMLYLSQEPRHLHYHPLEAIACGMPVIFMRSGLLERLGGADQPGACSDFREAKRKLRRTIDGDTNFAKKCIDAQKKILERFAPEHNETQWRDKFLGQILSTPVKDQAPVESVQIRERSRPSVAVLLPKPYRGGTLQVVKRLAKALVLGAQRKNTDLRVVLSFPEDTYDEDSEFGDLPGRGITIRPTTWRVLPWEESDGIIAMQGLSAKKGKEYVIPSDGCNDFLDCGFWLIVSDRVNRPILPIRPYGVYELDFIQRHVPETFQDLFFEIQKVSIVTMLRDAEFIITTTPALAKDVNCYAGIPRRRILKSPLLIEPPPEPEPDRPIAEDYFVWPTNSTKHKNHLRVLAALQKYYEQADGKLKTVMIGPLSDAFRRDNQEPRWNEVPYVLEVRRLIAETISLSENLVIAGELSDAGYSSAISHARFLLSPNLYDNGSFATIDAGFLGVPTLASRYPAQEHIAETCRLNPKWFDPYSVDDLTRALTEMESDADSIELPQREFLETLTWENRSEEIFGIIYPHVQRCSVDVHR